MTGYSSKIRMKIHPVEAYLPPHARIILWMNVFVMRGVCVDWCSSVLRERAGLCISVCFNHLVPASGSVARAKHRSSVCEMPREETVWTVHIPAIKWMYGGNMCTCINAKKWRNESIRIQHTHTCCLKPRRALLRSQGGWA